jgi:hypothetical protein
MVLEIQEHVASNCLDLVRAFWLCHNKADDIMVETHTRGKDHMIRQEAREIQGPGLLFFFKTTYSHGN